MYELFFYLSLIFIPCIAFFVNTLNIKIETLLYIDIIIISISTLLLIILINLNKTIHKLKKFDPKFYEIKTKIINFLYYIIFFIIIFNLTFYIIYLDLNRIRYINTPYFFFNKEKIYIIKITSPSEGIFNETEYKGLIIGEIAKNFNDKNDIYKIYYYNYKAGIKIKTISNNILEKNYLLLIKFSEDNYFKINKKTNLIYINLYDENIYQIYKIENKNIINLYNIKSKSIFSKFKNFILKNSKSILSKINLSFFFASITGSKIFLNKNLYNNYTLTGTSHILALSGLHLGIIIGIFVIISFIFNLNKKQTIILSLIFGFIYLLIVDFNYVSLIRAYFMLLFAGLIFLEARKLNPIKFIPAIFFIIFLFIKTQVFSLSFILSITSIFSIILIFPFLSENINSLKENFLIKYSFSKNKIIFANNFIKLINPFILSLTIVFFQAPLILFFFNRVNLFSWLINPVIILIFTIAFYITVFLLFLSLFKINIPLLNSFINSLFYFQHLTVDIFRNYSENLKLSNKNFDKKILVFFFLILLFIIYTIIFIYSSYKKKINKNN